MEIASSTPFGYVLRDCNRRERCRESNVKAVQAAFEKNLKVLVRDHLQSCISVDSGSQENSPNQIYSWVGSQDLNNRQNSFKISTNDNKNNNIGEDDCLQNTNRPSRVLDRWPARATADKPALERQASSPRLSTPRTATSSPKTLISKEESSNNSQGPSENSSRVENLGASSLVQIWEARMNRSNSINASQSQGISSSRTSSGLSNVESAPSNEEAARGSEVGESLDEKDNNQKSNGDAMRERESQSDVTIQSQSPCASHGRASLGESERPRVADIVRRLTSGSDDCSDHEQGNSVNESPTRERKQSSAPDQVEQRCAPPVITTGARIRGRQAFTDLLMQIERDRNRELESLAGRQAVSKFSQRGRLQATLRLRSLERCLAIQDRHRSKMTAADVSRLQQGSAAMLWREKVRVNVEQNKVAQPDARALSIENLNKTVESQNSSNVSKNFEANNCNGAFTGGESSIVPTEEPMSDTSKEQTKPTISEEQAMSSTVEEQVQAMSRISEDLQEAASQTCSEVSYSHSREIAETALSDDWHESERADEEEVNNQQHLNGWDENETEEEDEEDDDDDQHYYVDNSYDWYTDISRPRSYWEELRQAWYQEVLNTSSENQEIRQLLERRTVSTFLGSDMRERMDRLMISRIQIQTDMKANQEEDSEDEDAQEMANQWMLSYLQGDTDARYRQEEEEGRHDVEVEREEEHQLEQEEEGRHQEEEDREEEQVEDDDDDEEVEQEENLFNHQYFEASSDYFSQSSSQLFPSSPMRSWTYRDQEVSDDSDQVTSESQLTPSQPHSYSNNDQPSSFPVNQPSTEMELVYDLRGHMQQLQREISELRDSIKCCMEMQLKLQQCINQETLSVRGDEKRNSADKALVRRNCCICFEKNVDSLLYRCGHMCTCLKCAHELQWSSGKCPICRAPIMDVVRAFVDS